MRLRTLASIWIPLFALSITPLFLSSISEVGLTFIQVLRYLFPSICIIIGFVSLIKINQREKYRFSFTVIIVVFCLLAFEIFQDIFYEKSSNIFFGYWSVFWLGAYFCIIGLSLAKIIKDFRYITKEMVYVGIAIVGLTTVVVSPIFAYFIQAVGSEITPFEYAFFFILLSVDLISFIFLSILLVLYFRLNYGFYWLLVVFSFGMMLFRDLAFVYSLMLNKTYPLITPSVINFIFYSTMIIGLISLFDPDFELKTMQNIEMEREYYKARYKELNILSKDLITVTEFWFHDLHNDLSVLNNALELYEESSDEKFKKMFTDRLILIGERLKRFESPSSVLDSLKIKPTPISSILDVQKAYNTVKIQDLTKDIYVEANELLFPTILNIIHNSFQHNGLETEVIVLIEEMEEKEKIVISIKDNGKGIPDELKDRVFQKNFAFGKEETSGMGLYLAKITIDKYGGKISVEDNEPKGVLFKIELDILEPQP